MTPRPELENSQGQNENPPFSGLCQLPPAADIPRCKTGTLPLSSAPEIIGSIQSHGRLRHRVQRIEFDSPASALDQRLPRFVADNVDAS
jgi:hypothetical protein